MKIIITGVAGYIGGSFAFEMLNDDNQVIGIDNFSNSSKEVVDNIKEKFSEKFSFYNADLRDFSNLKRIFSNFRNIDGVFHFAALKNIPESQANQSLYFENNVSGTKNLIKCMKKNNINSLIFSSSAAIYGDQSVQPIAETFVPKPKSIYAQTKLECEKILNHESKASGLKAVSLRYFNPMGVFKDFKVSNSYSGSLIDSLLKSFENPLHEVTIYGNDYSTKDGTGERDYIHIEDLIFGHKAAHDYLQKNQGHHVFNLGAGKSYSVLEVISQFENVSGKKVITKLSNRRDGDVEKSFADILKAKKELKWKVVNNLEQMCIDALKGTS